MSKGYEQVGQVKTSYLCRQSLNSMASTGIISQKHIREAHTWEVLGF